MSKKKRHLEKMNLARQVAFWQAGKNSGEAKGGSRLGRLDDVGYRGAGMHGREPETLPPIIDQPWDSPEVRKAKARERRGRALREWHTKENLRIERLIEAQREEEHRKGRIGSVTPTDS